MKSVWGDLLTVIIQAVELIRSLLNEPKSLSAKLRLSFFEHEGGGQSHELCDCHACLQGCSLICHDAVRRMETTMKAVLETKKDKRFYAIMALIDTLTPEEKDDIREALTNLPDTDREANANRNILTMARRIDQ